MSANASSLLTATKVWQMAWSYRSPVSWQPPVEDRGGCRLGGAVGCLHRETAGAGPVELCLRHASTRGRRGLGLLGGAIGGTGRGAGDRAGTDGDVAVQAGGDAGRHRRRDPGDRAPTAGSWATTRSSSTCGGWDAGGAGPPGRTRSCGPRCWDQLVDPETFTRQADRGWMATPAECSHDEMRVPGRAVLRALLPAAADRRGHGVGRVWSLRGHHPAPGQLEQELRVQAFTESADAAGQPDLLHPAGHRGAGLQPAPGEDSMAVLLLDLDDFKTVNDSLGHVAAGDAPADRRRRTAADLRGTDGDVAARLGGDEFVVLLRELSGRADDAVYSAERVLAALSGRPLVVEGQTLTVRASIGIALPLGDEDAVDLLRNADLAMYAAKREGGARFRIFETGMHPGRWLD